MGHGAQGTQVGHAWGLQILPTDVCLPVRLTIHYLQMLCLQDDVSARTVLIFLRSLQSLVADKAKAGYPQWAEMLSPRLPLVSHPLISLF